MCDNKEDLKWCKAASNWTVPDNWTPMYIQNEPDSNHVMVPERCTALNDTDPRGQWINPEDMTDGIFQCINRKDEKPFSKQKMLLMVIVGLNWSILHVNIYRKGDAWGTNQPNVLVSSIYKIVIPKIC